ncbi:MAG: ABC transporter permease, partial [Oscillatoriales cyanobacterium SM2_2_1]|nr:ABC transporter permease [Oscillatoriales cyanobacterium SM2_2_1]
CGWGGTGHGLAVLGNVGQWVVLAGMLELALTVDQPWVPLGVLATLGVGSLLRLTPNQGMSIQFPWRLGLGVLLGSGPVLLVMLLWGQAPPSIPVIVMVMGAGLQSGVVALGVFADRLERDRGELEAHLSLGATLWQATQKIRTQALQSALSPQLVIIGVPIFVLAQVWAGVAPLRSVSHLIWLWAGLLWAALGSGYGVCFLLVLSNKIRN